MEECTPHQDKNSSLRGQAYPAAPGSGVLGGASEAVMTAATSGRSAGIRCVAFLLQQRIGCHNLFFTCGKKIDDGVYVKMATVSGP